MPKPTCILVGLCLGWSGVASAQQSVTFNSLDGTAIKAWVYQPKPEVGTSRGTVIALHGCGGLYASVGPRKGHLTARHEVTADWLLAEGYNVVFPDSLTPRGETELCTQKMGGRKVDQTQRRADVLAAVTWVAAQPWAKADRIALLGWSHGGSAVLAATDLKRQDVRNQPVQPVLAVAFYPGCTVTLKSNYQPSAPLVLMLGEKDDWTPPQPCVALGKAVGAEVNVYPDSYHGFDSPTGDVRLRTDVPNGVNPGQGVHVGPNPIARDQSYARLKQLLAKTLQP